MAHPFWPLFDLRVRTPRLELRYADDDLAFTLAELATQGIHDPGWMPFGRPWTDVGPDQLARDSVKHYWTSRAELTPAHWGLPLAVIVDGAPVGVQGIHADDFGRMRTVETGSWLGRRFQGAGIGKEMRHAVLHLAFAGLDAVEAVSGAWEDNVASLAVSRACGYEDNGDSWMVRRDERARMLHLRMGREGWEARRRDDIGIHGLEPCLELLVAS